MCRKGMETGWYLKKKIRKLTQKIISVHRALTSVRRHSFMTGGICCNWLVSVSLAGSSPPTQSIKEDMYSLFWERSHLTRQITNLQVCLGSLQLFAVTYGRSRTDMWSRSLRKASKRANRSIKLSTRLLSVRLSFYYLYEVYDFQTFHNIYFFSVILF